MQRRSFITWIAAVLSTPWAALLGRRPRVFPSFDEDGKKLGVSHLIATEEALKQPPKFLVDCALAETDRPVYIVEDCQGRKLVAYGRKVGSFETVEHRADLLGWDDEGCQWVKTGESVVVSVVLGREIP